MSEQATRVLLRLIEAGLNGSNDPGLTDDEVSSTNWSQITASARQHHLSGLLFRAVRRGKLDSALPQRTWAAVHADYYAHVARNLVLLNHAETLIETTRRFRVPLLFLKGSAFGGWLYDNPSLRPMTDLDVLIREQDEVTLTQIASMLGYEFFGRTSHGISLRHHHSGTYLELHTSLTSCPNYIGISTDELLARSVPTSSESGLARTLATEDHLLHLCLHGGFQQGFRQPAINACDIYLLVRRPELDWEYFYKRASTPRLAPFVYGGLSLSQAILPSTESKLAMETLETEIHPRQRFREHQVTRLLSPSPESAFGSPWSRFLMTPSFTDTLSLARETLSPCVSKRSPFLSALARRVTLVNRYGFSRWSRNLWSARAAVRTET